MAGNALPAAPLAPSISAREARGASDAEILRDLLDEQAGELSAGESWLALREGFPYRRQKKTRGSYSSGLKLARLSTSE